MPQGPDRAATPLDEEMVSVVSVDQTSLSRGDRSPARPSLNATSLWRPLGLDAAAITGGFWAPRQTANVAAIRFGMRRLEDAGNLQNLRIAAGLVDGEAIGPIFTDSDVYKWLEAVAWEYGRQPDDELLDMQRKVTAIIAAAQARDGYLNSVVQVRFGEDGRYRDLPWSHEHYCAGHLIQAAVAQVRCTGDGDLLDVAIRLADHLVATFGEDKRHDVDGHPVVEMALVELFRETGTREYLDLACYFVDARGHGLMEKYGQEPEYFSDRVPVRQATSVEGHAVRAVYLTAGAADVAAELDDTALLEALSTQFGHMWGTKTYLTGGLGSRWEGEAFGDPYELPADRAYAETCAAIGGVQWAWRMLLATGEARFADAIERILYNGFAAGVSLSGTEFFYVNPLQLRTNARPDNNRSPAHGRRGWFDCACCPPNVMRTLAQLAGYLATADGSGLQIHQYTSGHLNAAGFTVDVETDYPWDGRVRIVVQSAPSASATLSLRIPGWATGASVTVEGESQQTTPGYWDLTKQWAAGEEIILELLLEVRTTSADARIDAARGCVALERGPLVYAFEQVDQPADTDLDLVELVAGMPAEVERRSDLLGGVSVLKAVGRRVRRDVSAESWPFPRSPLDTDVPETPAEDFPLVAIPYYTWANREIGAMRVWVPGSAL